MTDDTTTERTPPTYVPTTPEGWTGFREGLLDEVRALDAKPQTRALFDIVSALPIASEANLQRLRAEVVEREWWLVEQLNAAFAKEHAHALDVDKGRAEAEHEARGNVVDQVNAVNAELDRRLSALEGRQQAVEGTVAQISAAPTPAPLDSAQLASVVAQQVLASLPSARKRRIQEIERDLNGEMVRITEYDGDELLDDLA